MTNEKIAVKQPRPPKNPTPSSFRPSAKGFYVVAVTAALGVLGGAIGFVIGIVPYYVASGDLAARDQVFGGCVALGIVGGLIWGAVRAPRWFRNQDDALTAGQGRMIRYLQRRRSPQGPTSDAAPRTLGAHYLEQVLGPKKNP